MKIALLKHRTRNIGDDIQRLALEALLPRVDDRIDRDDLSQASRLEPETKVILNGWFASNTHRCWPIPVPAKNLLYLGFHANDPGILPEKVTNPIGCRDRWTYELCLRKSIPAWLSWCVTLTIQRPLPAQRNNIFFVDIPRSALNEIPEQIVRDAQWMTHEIDPECDRDAEANRRLECYSTARLLVTSRLHAMLPCLAMEVPVVLIPPPFHPFRFDSYREMTWSLREAPWSDMRPKISSSNVHDMTNPLRKALHDFLAE